MGSLEDAIEEEPSRFVKYAFENNPNIENLTDFRKALLSAFDTDRGSHADISEKSIIFLFESQAVKDLIKENVSSEEYDKLYGDGLFVKREIQAGKIVTITQPKISIHSHTRAGIKVKAYSKGYRKWTNLEIKFLQVRKTKKLTPKQITNEYNSHFKQNPRSSSSIKTQIFRT